MVKKKKPPALDGMIEVTSSNRKALERRLGFEIPKDVEYILSPSGLTDLLDNPESWEEVKK